MESPFIEIKNVLEIQVEIEIGIRYFSLGNTMFDRPIWIPNGDMQQTNLNTQIWKSRKNLESEPHGSCLYIVFKAGNLVRSCQE